LQQVTGEEEDDEAAEEEEEMMMSAAGEEDDEASSETGGGGKERDPRKELEKRQKDLQPDIDTLLADSGYDMLPEMTAAMKRLEKAMDEEAIDRAKDIFEEVERLLGEYAGFMEKKGPLLQRKEAMAKGIDKILTISGFEYNLDNSEWISAATKLDWMSEQVEAAGDNEPEEEETTSSSDSDEDGGEEETSESETPPDPEALEQNRTEAVKDFNKEELAVLKKWLDNNKPKINAILKDRNSDNGKALVAALGNYAKALKAKVLSQAQDAVDEIELLLEKADREFKLSEKQREAILKELEKMESEIEALTAEMED